MLLEDFNRQLGGETVTMAIGSLQMATWVPMTAAWGLLIAI